MCRRGDGFGVRREVGFDVHLLHDVHHRLTPIEAARLGKSLEPHRLFWLEDPVPAEHQASFRTIRQHTTTPIAVGEVLPEMPLFLEPEKYVPAPLESTYQAAWAVFPTPLKDALLAPRADGAS